MHEDPGTRPSLILRLRDPGDDRAWFEFVEIYTPLIRRIAIGKGLQAADADDLVQDVLRAVVRAIDRFDPRTGSGTFRGWLSVIARNLVINLVSARRPHHQGTGDSEVHRILQELPEPTPEASAEFALEYRKRVLEWALGRVRKGFAEPVWNAFWQAGVEAKPAADVAQALGLSLGTVYQYKARVVARVRREIDQFEGGSQHEEGD